MARAVIPQDEAHRCIHCSPINTRSPGLQEAACSSSTIHPSIAPAHTYAPTQLACNHAAGRSSAHRRRRRSSAHRHRRRRSPARLRRRCRSSACHRLRTRRRSPARHRHPRRSSACCRRLLAVRSSSTTLAPGRPTSTSYTYRLLICITTSQVREGTQGKVRIHGRLLHPLLIDYASVSPNI